MRSVGLDLGARHISYCEVSEGVVVRRASVRRLSELEPMLGAKTAEAKDAGGQENSATRTYAESYVARQDVEDQRDVGAPPLADAPASATLRAPIWKR